MRRNAMKIAAFIFSISALLFGAAACLAQAPESKQIRDVPPQGFYSAAHQFVFFAVLEGCYTDGLNSEDLEKIIPDKSSWKNFVISCPICEPAYDGFRLYAERLTLSRQIGKITDRSFNTFGPGLDEGTREQLSKVGQPCRDVIKGLLQKWVDARIAKLRLDEKETKDLRDELAMMRKKGEQALTRYKSGEHGDWPNYKDWEVGCPICSGASPMGPE